MTVTETRRPHDRRGGADPEAGRTSSCPPRQRRSRTSGSQRKQKLAGALRIFGRVGFGEGVAGHITVRDPEFPEYFWVNPFADQLPPHAVSDLILVDHDGNVVYGTRPVNRAAFVIHAAIHEARPDVIAAAHSHSVHGKAFSSLGIPLDPITQDSCIFYEDHTVITEQRRRGRVRRRGRQASSPPQFPTGKAAIHQNHGLFTVGQSVDEAAFWFLSMDRSCQAQLLAMAAGTPKLIPHEDADVHARADRLRRSPVGSASSRCGRRSAAPTPTCSTERHRHQRFRDGITRGAVRPLGRLAVHRRGHRRVACSTRCTPPPSPCFGCCSAA